MCSATPQSPRDICLKEVLAQAPTGVCAAPSVAVLLEGAGGKLMPISGKVVRYRDAYTMGYYVASKRQIRCRHGNMDGSEQIYYLVNESKKQ